jgi:isopentenyl-diphosphate delta-isomerase
MTGNQKFSDDLLILVDGDDNILGYETKEKCHQGEGLLHRAFSIFIFNKNKELLIQKRSGLKLLWPLYWSNSVCSHPRKGESDLEAAHRRLKEEIDIDVPLRFLFKFQYQASFKDVGSENELCSVYIGITEVSIRANPEEIEEWKFIDFEELNRDMEVHPDVYTPWFKIEWERIKKIGRDPEGISEIMP